MTVVKALPTYLRTYFLFKSVRLSTNIKFTLYKALIRSVMIYVCLAWSMRRMRGWACHFKLLLVLASAVILRLESRRTHDHILLSQIRDSHNLEGQVPVFISSRNNMAQLYPQALGSLLVASFDSQGYGGAIRPCLHMGASIYMSKSSLNTVACRPVAK
jgi:hypothetical protein